MRKPEAESDFTTYPSPHLSLGDEEVVQRVKAGETALFEALMRRYNQRLYRVARSILRDDSEAEDVMQQAYVNAYLHLDQFAGRAKFSTWLTRIAVHEALARARRRGRLKGIDSMPDGKEGQPGVLRDERPDPEEQANTAELRRLLDAAVDGLPELYRSVFVLRDAEGLGTSEAAECLEISEQAVRTRLHRARSLLRQHIHQRTGATSASAFSFHLLRCDRVVIGVFTRLRTPLSSYVH
jgi:RNA polymerase sigma-70 factor (ECF subfamily)